MRKASVLVIGGGSREHALVWGIKKSTDVGEIYVAPGNAGTAAIANNIPIDTTDIDGLASFAREKSIDLTVVGPEAPLAMGITDLFRTHDLSIFGPKKAAAYIEASKVFSKQLMRRKRIPTAKFAFFDRFLDAHIYVKRRKHPLVIKADGLASGKGTYICHDIDETLKALTKIMIQRDHGEAGDRVVIENYIKNGRELSIHALIGEQIGLLPSSCDYKRLNPDKKSPNTGGMGAYSPVPWVTKKIMLHVKQGIIERTINHLRDKGITYSGCLYPGLMFAGQKPYVLEFNARFGDPEFPVLVHHLGDNLFSILEACAKNRLQANNVPHETKGYAVCVVLCSKEYPRSSTNMYAISGLDKAKQMDDVVVFHAATIEIEGIIYARGGRILAVTAYDKELERARIKAYRVVDMIDFEGMQCRTDIAQDIR